MRFPPRLVPVVFLALTGACATVARPPAPTWSGAPLEIPREEGRARFAPAPAAQFLVDPYPAPQGASWLGADVASSVRIDDERYVWLFGDTLLGSVSARCPDHRTYCDRRVAPEDGVRMIRNSVGIAERAGDGSFRRLVKYWPVRGGEDRDALASGVDGEFLWPLSGIRAGGALFIAANRHTPDSGLVPVGNVMVRIANPEAPPPQWRLTRHELPNFRKGDASSPSLVWTTALVRAGDRVLVFGQRGTAFEAQTVLARFAVDDMLAGGWRPRPEYLLRDERGDLRWSEAFDAARLHVVRGLPGTSESTVQYDPSVGWYTYQIPPLEFEVHLYTATDPEGPWRDGGVVYRLPSPWSTTPGADCAPAAGGCSEYIAYAVKSHPELAPSGGRVLSYNVNLGSGSFSGAEKAAETLPGFYVPQMIVGPSTLTRAASATEHSRSTAR